MVVSNGRWLAVCLLVTISCAMVDCAPARSGDLVFFKRFTTAQDKVGTMKMTIFSPSGTPRGGLLLPRLKNKQYDSASVAGRYAFVTVIPAVPTGLFPFMGLDLAVIDISMATPKVVAVLPVPMSALNKRANERCGHSSGSTSSIAARRASGSGQGSYRIALSIRCLFEPPRAARSCTSRGVVHTLSYDPKTPRALSEKPAQPVCEHIKHLYYEEAEEHCYASGVNIWKQKLGWQAGTRMALGIEYAEALLDRAGLVNVAGRKHIYTQEFFNSQGPQPQRDRSCEPAEIASPTTVYAACFSNTGSPSTRTVSIVELSQDGRKKRLIGQPLREVSDNYLSLATNTKASTPIYLVTQLKNRKVYRVWAAAKQSRLAFKPLFTSSLNLAGSSLHVLG